MKVFVDTKNHPKGLEKPCRKRPYRKETALKAEDLWQNRAQGGIERFARKKSRSACPEPLFEFPSLPGRLAVSLKFPIASMEDLKNLFA